MGKARGTVSCSGAYLRWSTPEYEPRSTPIPARMKPVSASPSAPRPESPTMAIIAVPARPTSRPMIWRRVIISPMNSRCWDQGDDETLDSCGYEVEGRHEEQWNKTCSDRSDIRTVSPCQGRGHRPGTENEDEQSSRSDHCANSEHRERRRAEPVGGTCTNTCQAPSRRGSEDRKENLVAHPGKLPTNRKPRIASQENCRQRVPGGTMG